MAETIDFPGTNMKLLAPGGSENVGELNTFTNGYCSVSCWRLTPAEIDEVVRTGCIFVSILSGRTQPPIFVGGEDEVRGVVVDYGGVWQKGQPA
jgi:hypothetical protein